MTTRKLKEQHCSFMVNEIGFSQEQALEHWKSMLYIKSLDKLRIGNGSFAEKLKWVQRNWKRAKEQKCLNSYVKWQK